MTKVSNLLTSRNQFIDLLYKSMNWFLYDRGLGHERVNYPIVISSILGNLKRKIEYLHLVPQLAITYSNATVKNTK